MKTAQTHFMIRAKNIENISSLYSANMSRLLWVTILLLGAAWFIGHYFNNPVPPDMDESSFYNIFVGLVSILIDLVSTDIFTDRNHLTKRGRSCFRRHLSVHERRGGVGAHPTRMHSFNHKFLQFPCQKYSTNY